MDDTFKERRECGLIPNCPDLAFPYVAYQKTDTGKYSAKDSLNYGTLFPALDMPFMNIQNKSTDISCKIKEAVYTLDFAAKELELYLDTHPDDNDALDMLKTVINMSRDAKNEYVRLYGPLVLSDVEKCDSYKWVNDPWPWEKTGRSGS